MNGEEFQDVVNFLEGTPDAILQLSGALIGSDLTWKPAADEFSAVEQVCHLRDIEREGYCVRIRKLLAEERPQLPDIDGSRLALERDYNRQDFTTAFQEFAQAREENLRTLRELAPEQLGRSGVLDGVGEITLAGLLLLMREHDQAHRREMADLCERRAKMKDESAATQAV
ncbi:MAG TPA: DinB family protein [Pyrinomonadaceae bacterium]|nr:DinB family protein [Pyrinomonadaceae bacterium]